MKPGLLLSFIIFLSSYAPLSLLFAVRDFETKVKWFSHPLFVYISLGLAVTSIIGLTLTMRAVRGQFQFTANAVSLRSNDLVNYSIPYLIAFFAVDFGKWQDVAALALFMGLLFLLTMKTQSLFINPILALQGWGLFEVEFEESKIIKKGIFLSKYEINKGKHYKMDKLSQFLYVVTEIVEE
jgi:hypothetical protein